MNNRHILLVRPQNIFGLQSYPPLGLIALGTVLTKAGYDIEIAVNDGNSGFEERLINKAKKALFVGITATTAEIRDAVRLAKILRNIYNKDLPLVWGGCHTTLFPEQMEKSELVDFAVAREGEDAILQIAQHISGKKPLLNGKIVRNAFIDINELPLARYDLVNNIELFISRPLTDKFQEYYKGRFRWLPYESSRGCPYRCAFCINVVTQNRKYRVKEPQKVAAELAELVVKYKLTHIKIIDDLFFLRIERVRKIFEEASRLGVNYTWDAECRIDFVREGFVDDEIMDFLKRNGLVQLTFGIESGSLDSLKRMRKGGMAGPKYAIAAIEMCAKHNIACRGSFVLDIPGDTPEDIMKTVRLIRRLRKFSQFACGVHTYRPYPKSSLCEQLVQKKKFSQPTSLAKWDDNYWVRQYTDTAIVRRWQENYKISSKISFYESLESAFWVKPHQIANPLVNLINTIFIKIARIRNRYGFYSFSLDKWLYIFFKDICIKFFTVV